MPLVKNSPIVRLRSIGDALEARNIPEAAPIFAIASELEAEKNKQMRAKAEQMNARNRQTLDRRIP